jgi:hypothetical protein
MIVWGILMPTAERTVRCSRLFGRAAACALIAFAFVATACTSAFAGTVPPVKVAVIRSQTTIDWLNNRRTPGSYPHGGKETAAFNYLKSRGYDVTEIVADRDLMNMDTLRQYDVIVLPLVFAMSTKASINLARYVGEGGGIVSSMSSPRAASEYANRPGTKNDMREWWWHVMGTNDWEWGPLSQVYQARVVNDDFTPRFGVRPNGGNPVVAGAQAILAERGFSPDISGMNLLRDPGAGLELSIPLKRTTASSVAYFNILDPKIKKRYPGTYTAAMSARYREGRSVYYYFSVVDFLPTYNTVLSRMPTAVGTPQGEVAGAMLESAIRWAGTPDGVAGPVPTATTYASVKAKSSGISTSARVRNTGTLITYGTVRVRIYNAAGKLVHSWAKRKVSLTPGASRSISHRWKKRLGGGDYRVEVSYGSGYPFDSSESTSGVTIRRGKSGRTR